MATQAKDHIGLYIAIPLYFVLLICCAYYARSKIKKHTKVDVEIEDVDGAGIESDALTVHFLGGRDFGVWLLPGTMFAGWFSGYTIVGVPNEAYRTGWLSLRWMVATIGVVVVLTAVSPRLQKAGLVRNHQSSVDFLTDRFQSQLVRYTCFVLQIFPSIIYLAGQCTAIKSTFNSIFGIDQDSVVALLVICALILVFEFVGGLTSVAITDTLQATVMIICFILLSGIVKIRYGGWTDLDWETYPQPSQFQTPSNETAFLFWSFVFVSSSLFTLPPFFMRTYAASSPRSVKAGLVLLSTGPFCLMLPAIFVGIMAVQIIADEGVEVVTSPFSDFLNVLLANGGFSNFVAVITYTASLAAIMSTADSVLIGISHLVTVECVYPIIPDASPARLKMIGSVCSVISMAVAILISIFGGNNISELASIQFSLSMQIAPAFIIGLFVTQRYDCHPFCIFAGALVGFITTFCIHFTYMAEYKKGNIESVPFDSGLGGFIANIAIIFMSECIHRVISKKNDRSTDHSEHQGEDNEKDPNQQSSTDENDKSQSYYIMQPKWDIPQTRRFGEVSLTPLLMYEMMNGINEPFTQSWAWTLLFLLLSVSMTPFGVGGIPPLSEEGILEYAPGLIRGIPAWAFSIIMYSVFTTAILLGILWYYPNEFPANNSMNPHTDNLTKAELSQRSSYDASNEQAALRRSSSLIQRKGVNVELGFNNDDGPKASVM